MVNFIRRRKYLERMDFHFQLRILLDVFIAVMLGGALGLEREKNEKPLGIRTNMLIAGAAALLVALGRYMALEMEHNMPEDAMGVDPTRIIHAIIVGVSFIGAGSILKSPQEATVKYLTTAATILFSAGIGICAALGLYVLAVGIMILGLIINLLVKRLVE